MASRGPPQRHRLALGGLLGGQNFTVMPEQSDSSVQEWLLTPGATLQTALLLWSRPNLF
jgi:hypothetical protein